MMPKLAGLKSYQETIVERQSFNFEIKGLALNAEGFLPYTLYRKPYTLYLKPLFYPRRL